jgi:hypothetical protein
MFFGSILAATYPIGTTKRNIGFIIEARRNLFVIADARNSRNHSSDYKTPNYGALYSVTVVQFRSDSTFWKCC